MKRLFVSLMVVLSSLSFVAVDAEAGRLGGARNSGMKRQSPPPQETPATPAKQQAAAPANAAAPAAAAATPPKRSWMGPLAGLAAGLGLAALMSHLGLGGAFADIMMVLLLAAVAFFAVRFLLRRFGSGAAKVQAVARPELNFAGAGNGAGQAFGSGSAASAAVTPPAVAARFSRVPEGFDAPAFERVAKLIFIRMQAANDAGDLNDLRQFSTPEMFAEFKLDLQGRRQPQQTDVVELAAQVIDFEATADQQIVSVRFHGLVREDAAGGAVPFDEVWHLVKPADGSREWAIAGISQSATA